MATDNQWLSVIYTQLAQVVVNLGTLSDSFTALSGALAPATPRSLGVTAPEYEPDLSGALGLWRVPAGKEWEFLGMSVFYVASSTVGARQMATLLTVDGRSMRFVAAVSQSAGQDHFYESAPNLVDYNPVRRQTLTICTSSLVLPENSTAQFSMLSPQATDTWTNYSLFVKERSL